VSVKYLLPCRCGQKVAVEPRQAGQTVVCACGQSLPVPTMLEVTALEPAPIEADALKGAGNVWGGRQAMLMLGVVMLLATIGGGVWVYRTRPIAHIDMFNSMMAEEQIQKLPPALTWQNWQAAKQGIGGRTDPRYEDAVIRFRTWATVVSIVAVGGITLIALGAAKRRAPASAKGPSADPSLRT
jgi:hypothetical protein